MPVIIRASTPEQAVEFIVDLIRAEEMRFKDQAATKSTLRTREAFTNRAAACDHIATMLEDVIVESLEVC